MPVNLGSLGRRIFVAGQTAGTTVQSTAKELQQQGVDTMLGRVKQVFNGTVKSAAQSGRSRASAAGSKARQVFDDVSEYAEGRLDEELIPKAKGTYKGFSQGRTGKAVRGTASGLSGTLADLASSKAGIAGIAIGAGAVGFGSSVGPAMKDAAFEAAFDDTEADRYFTGRDLDARFLAGSLMGGVGGGLLQATAPGDYFAANPPINSDTFAASIVAARTATGPVTGSMGAAAGAFLGSGFGKTGSKIGKIGGGLVGGVVGANLGILLPALGVGAYMNNNREFFQNSPYSSTRSTQSALNASGDIVLGMHNSRRGY